MTLRKLRSGWLVAVLLLLGLLVALRDRWLWILPWVDPGPPPGEMVDVGGFRLHLVCDGEGGPVVVLDSGQGDLWLTWFKVQPELSRLTRVCSYDRAGIGYSDPSPHPRSRRRTEMGVTATEMAMTATEMAMTATEMAMTATEMGVTTTGMAMTATEMGVTATRDASHCHRGGDDRHRDGSQRHRDGGDRHRDGSHCYRGGDDCVSAPGASAGG